MLILDQVVDCVEGQLGVIAFDSPGTGNALTPSIIDQMLERLAAWAEDPRIALVLLHGIGQRGFCCGVDICSLNETISRHDLSSTANFLAQPQTLVYRLSQYPKPLLAWAHGMVSGAGLGILSACRYRLGTPSLALQLPELALGLVPYAGASQYLNRLNGVLGLFLALSGLTLNLADARRLGLIDHVLPDDDPESLLQRLRAERWAPTPAANDNRLHRLFQSLATTSSPALPASRLAALDQARLEAVEGMDLTQRLRTWTALKPAADAPWWEQSREQLQRLSPLAARLLEEQLRRGRELSLADSLRMELDLLTHCSQRADVMAAIKRKLSEHAGPTAWGHRDLDKVPDKAVSRCFESPWGLDDHPLAHL